MLWLEKLIVIYYLQEKNLQLCHFFPNFLLKVIFLFEHENWFYVALLVKAI